MCQDNGWDTGKKNKTYLKLFLNTVYYPQCHSYNGWENTSPEFYIVCAYTWASLLLRFSNLINIIFSVTSINLNKVDAYIHMITPEVDWLWPAAKYP